MIGALLATGAPLGLIVLWWTTSRGGGALVRDLPTLLYVALSTLAVFSTFGYVLGRQVDALAHIPERMRLASGTPSDKAADIVIRAAMARRG